MLLQTKCLLSMVLQHRGTRLRRSAEILEGMVQVYHQMAEQIFPEEDLDDYLHDIRDLFDICSICNKPSTMKCFMSEIVRMANVDIYLDDV